MVIIGGRGRGVVRVVVIIGGRGVVRVVVIGGGRGVDGVGS